jgi:hypothetical protein
LVPFSCHAAPDKQSLYTCGPGTKRTPISSCGIDPTLVQPGYRWHWNHWYRNRYELQSKQEIASSRLGCRMLWYWIGIWGLIYEVYMRRTAYKWMRWCTLLDRRPRGSILFVGFIHFFRLCHKHFIFFYFILNFLFYTALLCTDYKGPFLIVNALFLRTIDSNSSPILNTLYNYDWKSATSIMMSDGLICVLSYTGMVSLYVFKKQLHRFQICHTHSRNKNRYTSISSVHM